MSRNIIQSQIQSLRTHPHIKKLDKINDRLIQLLYYPKDLKNHYAQSQYRLKIELPTKYPEEPPSVKFIDPINHINISQKNGEVMMPIFAEDWSPYISLYIIIDAIDGILVEPELSPQYCVGPEKSFRIKDKSRNDSIQSNAFKKIDEVPFFQTHEQEISMIKRHSSLQRKEDIDEQESKPIGTMKKKLKRLKTIILEKSQKINPVEEKSPNSPNQFHIFQQFDKIQEEHSFVLNEKEEQQQESMKIMIEGKVERFKRSPELPKTQLQESKPIQEKNIAKPVLKVKELESSKMLARVKSQSKFDQSTPKRQKTSFQQQGLTNRKAEEKSQSHKFGSSTIFFQNTYHSLEKINRMIVLFTSELLQLQKKRGHTKNQCLARIIDRKIEEQVGMLEELEQLAFTVKRSMLANLKRQINK